MANCRDCKYCKQCETDAPISLAYACYHPDHEDNGFCGSRYVNCPDFRHERTGRPDPRYDPEIIKEVERGQRRAAYYGRTNIYNPCDFIIQPGKEPQSRFIHSIRSCIGVLALEMVIVELIWVAVMAVVSLDNPYLNMLGYALTLGSIGVAFGVSKLLRKINAKYLSGLLKKDYMIIHFTLCGLLMILSIVLVAVLLPRAKHGDMFTAGILIAIAYYISYGIFGIYNLKVSDCKRLYPLTREKDASDNPYLPADYGRPDEEICRYCGSHRYHKNEL